MNYVVLFGIALGMAMDVVAVSFSDALMYRQDYRRCLWLLPLSFGLFQGIMPVFGFAAASSVSSSFDRYGGPVSFVILCWIGGRMIYSTVKNRKNPPGTRGSNSTGNRLTLATVLAQAVATSIDALMVGVSFALSHTPLVDAALIIAVVSATLSFIAVILAERFGRRLSAHAEIIGGCILILIGFSNLFT
jgi:putative Mn2+ efflux pump MntP